MKTSSFATKLPVDIQRALDLVCRKLGLKKSFVVETALREKIEDLIDAEDLRGAIAEAAGFHDWDEVKKEARRGRRR